MAYGLYVLISIHSHGLGTASIPYISSAYHDDNVKCLQLSINYGLFYRVYCFCTFCFCRVSCYRLFGFAEYFTEYLGDKYNITEKENNPAIKTFC